MFTNLDFLQVGQTWPPSDQDTTEKWALIEANKKLFEGKHDEVYKDWIKLLRDDQQATLEFIFNWPKRLSTLWADLLLGEPPRYNAGDQQAVLDEIVERNDLHNKAYMGAIDVSRYGDTLLKIWKDANGKVWIDAQQLSYWVPVVSPSNVQEYIAHVLVWTEIKTEQTIAGAKKVTYLNAEIHEKGKISRRKFKLDGNLIKEEAELDPGQKPEEQTGIADDFLIVPIHNLKTTDRATGLDDYSDLESINQEFEVRVGQISRILDKHADPNMYGPASALEESPPGSGNWVVRGGGSFWPVAGEDKPPGYIVWEGKLDQAFKELELLKDEFYFNSETCAAAFGKLDGGLQSGVSIKRVLMAPLAKVNRIRLRFDPGLKKALKLAAQLQGTKVENLKIEWQDGLPTDEKEQAEIDSTLFTAGLLSLETALRRRGFEGDGLKEEMARIAADRTAMAPAAAAGPKVTLTPQE